MSETEQKFVIFLNKVGIECSSLNELEGLEIQRNTLLNMETYVKIKDDIPDFRKLFSSSYLTSLQTSAPSSQKWPLINIVRQLLKIFYYDLVPKRLCDGYTKAGIKIYRRVFIIKKRIKYDDIPAEN
jgi:hypothetical protein